MSYVIEYAKSARAGCRGGKVACEANFGPGDRKIAKGHLRLGSEKEVRDHLQTFWIHFECVSKQTWGKAVDSVEGDVSKIRGFEDLTPEDQERVREAAAGGEPPKRAREAEAEGEEAGEGEEPSPKKKAKGAKAKAAGGAKGKGKGKKKQAVEEEESNDE